MTDDTATASSNHAVLRGLLIALLGFFVFSTHDAFVKTLGDYSVFQIIFFAMLFGYVPFSLAQLTDSRQISLRPVNPWLVFVRALLMVGSACFAFLSFSMLPMVQVYVLLFLTPAIISLLAIPVLGERIHIFRWSMILIGLLGVIIVLRPSPDSLKIGHLMGLLAAFCSAGASIISRKIGQLETSATLILSPLLLNIIVTGSLLYFVYKPMPLADLALMFLIGVMGLLGQLCVLTAYRNAPATVVAPMQYSQLVWAIIYGALFFNDSVDVFVIIGSLITMLSGVLMVWRESRVSQHRPILRTRNVRAVLSAPLPSFEWDKLRKPKRSQKNNR